MTADNTTTNDKAAEELAKLLKRRNVTNWNSVQRRLG